MDKMIEFRMLETTAFENFISSVKAELLRLAEADFKAGREQADEVRGPITQGLSRSTQPGLTRAEAKDPKSITS
jgi:hypothetical protein